MIDDFEEWPGGKANTLAVVLHGWVGSREKMKDVTEATKEALGSDGGVDVYAPQLPYRRWWSVARAPTMVIKLLLKEPLINLRIMAHCAFDSRAAVWTGS